MVESKVIRAIRSAQPSVTFMIANQNSPVPEHVFCEVYVIGNAFSGTPEITNDEVEETIKQITLYKVSLTYHGLATSNAIGAVNHMAAYLESFQARLKFKEEGLSIIRVQDVQHSSMLKDVDMYMTYSLDITVATEQGHSFGVDVVDVVGIEGSLGITDYNIEVKI